jgi:hypothetical protein
MATLGYAPLQANVHTTTGVVNGALYCCTGRSFELGCRSVTQRTCSTPQVAPVPDLAPHGRWPVQQLRGCSNIKQPWWGELRRPSRNSAGLLCQGQARLSWEPAELVRPPRMHLGVYQLGCWLVNPGGCWHRAVTSQAVLVDTPGHPEKVLVAPTLCLRCCCSLKKQHACGQ